MRIWSSFAVLALVPIARFDVAVLTAKQEAFALCYVETGNATEAYRRCYDTTTSNEATLNRKAKEVLDNGKVAARIAELRKPAAEAAQITLIQHLEDLKRLRDMAESQGKFGPAIHAEVSRGKASGLYTEHIELTMPVVRVKDFTGKA
jgi:phage terminase small subunit